MSVRTLLSEWWWLSLPILFFCYVRYLRPGRPDELVKDLDIFLACCVFAFLIGYGEVARVKNGSPKVIASPISSSLGTPPWDFYHVGLPYKVFRLGGYRSMLLNSLGGEGVLISPSGFVHRLHENYAVHGIIFQVDLDSLPLPAQSYILEHGLRPPYYEAQFPILGFVGDSSSFDILSEYRKVMTEQTKLLQNKWATIEEFNSKASNAAQSFSKPEKSFSMWPFGGDKKP